MLYTRVLRLKAKADKENICPRTYLCAVFLSYASKVSYFLFQCCLLMSVGFFCVMRGEL